MLLSSTSSRRTSIVDVNLVLTHFDFHLNAFFITLCPKCDIPDVNSVNTDFLILSSPFHITCYFETRPVLPQKSTKMHLVCTICSCTAKTSALTPSFHFMILIKTVFPFDKKKNWHKSIFQFFGNFTKLYGLSNYGSNSVCNISILLWSVK